MTRDRRRFPRIEEVFHAAWRPTGDAEEWREIRTENLSIGGLRFLSERPLQPHTDVQVRVKHPMLNEHLELAGIVAWTRTPAAGLTEAGVEFTHLSERQELRIDEMVQFLMKGYPASPTVFLDS